MSTGWWKRKDTLPWMATMDEDGAIHLDLEPGRKYTSAELEELGTQFLKTYCRAINEETGKPNGLGNLLFQEHVQYRRKREVYNTTGIADYHVSKIVAENYRNNKTSTHIDY